MEQKELPKQPTADGGQVAQEQPKVQPRTALPRRRSLLFGAFLRLVVALIVLGGCMYCAYAIGKNQPISVEKQRQTVVQEGEVIANVAEEVGPSVVSIVTSQTASVNSLYYGTRTRTTQAAGTGLIIDSNGLILTNKHVVPEGTAELQVITSDGTKYEKVEIVGRDSLNDLAILKVSDPKNFKAAQLADSDKVRTGQKVIAIGNALGQFQNTVTSGIISGLGRPIEAGDESGTTAEQLTNLFQTDAAINSGNSGGPLLNYNGEVIGINTAIAADAQNIGFAIPINDAKGIIESVQTTGKITRAYLGVNYVMLTADTAKELNLSVTQGAYISTEEGSVVSGSPAEKAGLKGGDVITSVDSTKLTDSVALASAVGRHKVGDEVVLTIIRSGKQQTIKVKLGESPAG
jgi:serine protease Do